MMLDSGQAREEADRLIWPEADSGTHWLGGTRVQRKRPKGRQWKKGGEAAEDAGREKEKIERVTWKCYRTREGGLKCRKRERDKGRRRDLEKRRNMEREKEKEEREKEMRETTSMRENVSVIEITDPVPDPHNRTHIKSLPSGRTESAGGAETAPTSRARGKKPWAADEWGRTLVGSGAVRRDWALCPLPLPPFPSASSPLRSRRVLELRFTLALPPAFWRWWLVSVRILNLDDFSFALIVTF